MMLDHYREELISVTRDYTEKDMKRFKINNLINLSEKLRVYSDLDVEEMMIDLKDQLKRRQSDEGINKKMFDKTYGKLTITVKERFDLHERGSISGSYIGIGIALGAGVGTALGSLFAGNVGVGIGVGIAIGAGIGSTKEKKLEEENKLY